MALGRSIHSFTRYRPRRRSVALGAIAAVTVMSGAWAAPLASAAGEKPLLESRASATTTTFLYTGAEQTYQVPAGTLAVTVTATGARGGADWYSTVPGGPGAVVTATVPLPPGTTTLYVEVGGAGSTPASQSSGAAGGFNGGGASSMSWGGSGGGASDVRTQPASVPLTSVDSRLLVAGGGGGTGSGYAPGGSAGGAGHGSITGAGAGGNGSDSSATLAAAGDGGLGGTVGGTAGALAPSSTGLAAQAGQVGYGGAGSAGYWWWLGDYVTFAGGGGGGYYGGGGGGDGTYGGGGGAGSSYWVPSAWDTSIGVAPLGDATVSITPAPASGVAFSSASATVAENVGVTDLTVTRIGETSGTASVHYAATGGSATPGADFQLAPGTVTFVDGQTTATIPVTVVDDSASEGAETVTVTLSSPASGTVLGAPSATTLTLSSSDQQPDGWISTAARTGYVGNNVYNDTGASQTKSQPAPRKQTRTFYVRVYNDGSVANTFLLNGSAAAAGSTVRYFSGKSDITSAMRSAAGYSVRLKAGAYRVITVQIKALAGAAIGARKPATVSASWSGDGTRRDLVKAVVKVTR